MVSSLITASQPEGWGWKKITLDEQTQFVMIRFSSNETAITEMVLYGIPQDTIPPAHSDARHKGLTQIPLNRFLGVNYVMEDEARWLKPFYYSRLYNFALDFDDDTNRDESKVRFNMLHYGYYNNEKKKYVFSIDTLQQIQKGEIWFSIRGVSKWMSDLHYSDKDRPVNRPGMNPEDPAREWLVIYNPDGAAVDMSGWKLSRGANFAFPAGTVMGSGLTNPNDWSRPRKATLTTASVAEPL